MLLKDGCDVHGGLYNRHWLAEDAVNKQHSFFRGRSCRAENSPKEQTLQHCRSERISPTLEFLAIDGFLMRTCGSPVGSRMKNNKALEFAAAVASPSSNAFSFCQSPFWKAVMACSVISSPSMCGPHVSKTSRNLNGFTTLEPANGKNATAIWK